MRRLCGAAPRIATCAIAVCGALTAAPAPASAVGVPTSTWTYGRSVGHRPVIVTRRGFASADVTDVLVVGVIHGNETAGVPITRRLRSLVPPPGVRLWIIDSSNPDGQRAGSRQNLRGVDLNRNFPFGWRGGGSPFDVFFPGHAAGSEPEGAVLRRLIGAVRPDVTIWYHQHMDLVVRPDGAARIAVARAYAYASGMRLRAYPGPALYGTATSWQNTAQPAGAAFVVELPAGALPRARVARHAQAVLRTGAFVHTRDVGTVP